MRTTFRLLGLIVCVLALVPAAAMAHHRVTIAPPGDSAISQYVEDVPTAGGPTPTQGLGSGAPAAGGGLSASLTRRLSHLGPTGRQLLVVAASTGPTADGLPALLPGRAAGIEGSGRSRAVDRPLAILPAATVRSGASAAANLQLGRATDRALQRELERASQSTSSAGVLADAITGGGAGGWLAGLMLAAALLCAAWSIRRGRAR